jgi:hypothetical protein
MALRTRAQRARQSRDRRQGNHGWPRCRRFARRIQRALSILFIVRASGLVMPLLAQEEPLTEQGYEREELGVNLNTARSPRTKYRNS